MTNTIESALTDKQWAYVKREGAVVAFENPFRESDGQYRTPATGDLVDAIALCNEDLPDSDLHKITRAKIALLRDMVDAADPVLSQVMSQGDSLKQAEDEQAAMLTFLDALAAYLPPEGT